MKKCFLLIICLLTISCTKEVIPIESENVLDANRNEFEYGEIYKLKDIFSNTDITFEDEYLDFSKLGDNTKTIKYTLDNTLYEESFAFKVVDTTAPLIWMGKSFNIYVGDVDNFANRITCADNYDQKPKCYVEGDYDPNTAGDYNLSYVAEDTSGNIEKNDFILHVIDKTIADNNETPPEEEMTRTNIEDVISKYKNDNTMIGIDVSKFQGEIDWKEVKNAGIEFAIIRVGLGYNKGDGDVIKLDDYFYQNIEGAIANDIKVGAYFYSYAYDNKMAKKHAKFVIKNIKDYDITMPVAFDWENFADYNEYGLSLYDLRELSNTFAKEISKEGYTPLHYASKNYQNAFWNPVKSDIWLAHYNVEETDYDKPIKMWQLCQDGSVPGINHAVDIDVYYK